MLGRVIVKKHGLHARYIRTAKFFLLVQYLIDLVMVLDVDRRARNNPQSRIRAVFRRVRLAAILLFEWESLVALVLLLLDFEDLLLLLLGL